MKFLLVLLAVFKYILLFLLILLLLIIILAFVFSLSPIRYSVTVNYKEKDVYLNLNATYLGKIVGFNFKKKNKQSLMVARVFNKKIKITPDIPEAPPKTNSEQKNTNLSTKVAQKVTPTDTLEENTNLNNTADDSNIKNTVSDTENSVSNVDLNENISEQNANYVQDEIKESAVEKTAVQAEEEAVTPEVETKVETASEAKTESEKKAEIETEEESSSNTSSKSTKKTKKRKSLGEKIYSIFENFNSVLDNIYSYIYTYQNYPYRDKLFKKFKKIIHSFIEALKPKTIDISGKFYIKDPALTGKTLGYVYALYGLSTRFNISLDADFETEKTDVTALVSGKIIIFKLVLPVVSFIWLGLKAEAKRRGITRFKLIKILIQYE